MSRRSTFIKPTAERECVLDFFYEANSALIGETDIYGSAAAMICLA